MRMFAVLLLAASTLLTGCVVAEPQHRGDRDGDRDGIPNRMGRDRDGDGVPNRQDRRPDDPRRY